MTTREQAMQWWESLGNSGFLEKIAFKQELTDKYFQQRNFGTLTDSEIEEIFRKENKTEENIYLNRLKEQYIKAQELWNGKLILKNCYEYDAVRLFCLDTQLISFNDIEAMEYEVNQSF